MLLDVKQKSGSDADILLSFDQSNCKVGSKSVLAGLLKFTQATRSVSERHIGLNSKGGPSDRFCCGLGTDLLLRPCHL
jgi:hypothetical protein